VGISRDDVVAVATARTGENIPIEAVAYMITMGHGTYYDIPSLDGTAKVDKHKNGSFINDCASETTLRCLTEGRVYEAIENYVNIDLPQVNVVACVCAELCAPDRTHTCLTVVHIATKDIQPESELIVSYGFRYWVVNFANGVGPMPAEAGCLYRCMEIGARGFDEDMLSVLADGDRVAGKLHVTSEQSEVQNMCYFPPLLRKWTPFCLTLIGTKRASVFDSQLTGTPVGDRCEQWYTKYTDAMELACVYRMAACCKERFPGTESTLKDVIEPMLMKLIQNASLVCEFADDIVHNKTSSSLLASWVAASVVTQGGGNVIHAQHGRGKVVDWTPLGTAFEAGVCYRDGTVRVTNLVELMLI
jgi:hypothetical protein